MNPASIPTTTRNAAGEKAVATSPIQLAWNPSTFGAAKSESPVG